MDKSKWILIVLFGILLLLVSIVSSIQFAPIFTATVLVVFALSVGFMFTEEWSTHDANEFENRFWCAMAFSLSSAFFFSPDSPFHCSLLIGLPIVGCFTYSIHIYDRHLHRKVLIKVPNIAEKNTLASSDKALLKLQLYVDIVDQPFLSSTFLNIFNLPTVLKTENDIISIFKDASDEELNFYLANEHLHLGRIFYKVKDHKFAQQNNRTTLLELLAMKRIRILNVLPKAMLLHAFQVMKLSAHPKSEQYVKNIILHTKENDLTELKCLTDSKGDVNSMHKLIYVDIRNPVIRAEILAFLKGQANCQRAHRLLATKKGKKNDLRAWKKILSDVDDTLTCSGGSWPAGIDLSYPKYACYPGVMAFYRELDLGSTGYEEWDSRKMQGNLAFLSARPHIYKAYSEDETYKKFTNLKKRGLYTSPSLLAGSLETGTHYVLKDDLEPMARKKYDNLQEYMAIYPEFQCVFIGDNGQGDVRAAEMIQDSEFKDTLYRVYIHEVKPIKQSHALKSITKSSNCPYIYYFQDYVDAALDATKRKLIRLSGLRRIMVEAVLDFKGISSLDWARAELLKKEKDSQIRHDAKTRCVINKPETPPASEPTTPANSKKAPAPNPAQPSSTTTTSHPLANSSLLITSRPSKPISASRRQSLSQNQYPDESLRDQRLRELNQSLRRGNARLVEEGLAPVELLKFSQRFEIGSAVCTPYGKGVVTRFRAIQGIYEVLLQWDASGSKPPVKAFLQPSSLTLLPKITQKPKPSKLHLFGARPPLPPVTPVLRSVATMAPPLPSEKSKSTFKFLSSSTLAPKKEAMATATTPTRPAVTPSVVKHSGVTPNPLPPIPPVASSQQPTQTSTAETESKEQARLLPILGSIVWTRVGLGSIIDHRIADDMLIISVGMGGNHRATCYIPTDDVVQLTDPALTTTYQEQLRRDKQEKEKLEVWKKERLAHEQFQLQESQQQEQEIEKMSMNDQNCLAIISNDYVSISITDALG